MRKRAAGPFSSEEADRWTKGTALPGAFWHGSQEGDLNELHPGAASYQHGGSIGSGIYISPVREGGEFYGPNVYEVRLNVKKPFILDDHVNYTSEDEEVERIVYMIDRDMHDDFVEWLLNHREDRVIDIIREADDLLTDEAFKEWALEQGADDIDSPDFPEVIWNYIESDSIIFSLLAENFGKEWAESEVERMQLPGSILVGEPLSPFYLDIEGVIYTVGFKRPDKPDWIEIDLEEIGNEVRQLGYDAVVWYDRAPYGEVLLFDPRNVAIIGERKERRREKE